MNAVVDSSVAIKWYVEEEWHREAISVLRENVMLFAPDLLICEMANIAWKKVRRGQMTSLQGRLAVQQSSDGGINIVRTSLLGQRAWDIAAMLDRPAYDCFYLACAEISDSPLVTADARLCSAVEGTSFHKIVRHVADA